MKKKLLGLILLIFLVQWSKGRTLEDMAGRRISVPKNIERILPYDSRVSILLFPCCGGHLISKGKLPGKSNYRYISQDFVQLPETDISHLEEVLITGPDIVIAGAYLPDEDCSRFDQLQERINIPVAVIDMSLDRLDETYNFLGNLLEDTSATEPLVLFLSDLYASIQTLKDHGMPGDVSAYYTLGPTGLMTDPSGSKHTQVLDLLGIPNAAQIDIPSGGHAKVNMEQVIAWNPGYIFTAGFKGGTNAKKHIESSPLWTDIEAVKFHRVYRVPGTPFGWFDHPPSVNRIPGLIWLCQIFYGQKEIITREKIQRFYALFYHYNLNNEEYNQLLTN